MHVEKDHVYNHVYNHAWNYITVYYQQIVYSNTANETHGFTIDFGKFILKLHRLYAVFYVISRVAILQWVINTCWTVCLLLRSWWPSGRVGFSCPSICYCVRVCWPDQLSGSCKTLNQGESADFWKSDLWHLHNGLALKYFWITVPQVLPHWSRFADKRQRAFRFSSCSVAKGDDSKSNMEHTILLCFTLHLCSITCP